MLGLALLSPMRSVGALAAFLVATTMALGGLGLTLAAFFLALEPVTGAAWACLATALASMAIALVALAIADRLVRSPGERAPGPATVEGTAEAAAGLLLAWTRDHPGQATIAAATAGFALAALPELRRALADIARGFAAGQPGRPPGEDV
jgi:hypothetical protein